MNNFIFDEMAAEETRKDRMTEAKAHNERILYLGKNSKLSIFSAVQRLFASFKKSDPKIQNKEISVASHKHQREMAKSAK